MERNRRVFEDFRVGELFISSCHVSLRCPFLLSKLGYSKRVYEFLFKCTGRTRRIKRYGNAKGWQVFGIFGWRKMEGFSRILVGRAFLVS